MMSLKIDHYTYRARLLPALFTILPIAVALSVWFPDKFVGWGMIFGFITTFGGTALLSQLGRDWGKSKEPGLFKKWGGIPTTRMLRNRQSSLERTTLARYHLKLAELLGRSMPDADVEKDDVRGADDIYASATQILREKTRDKQKFPLIYAENVNYGFRRNLWGMKGIGITLSAIGIILCLMHIFISWRLQIPMSPAPFVGALVNIFLLFGWLTLITPGWVRIPADAYARNLLASLDSNLL